MVDRAYTSAAACMCGARARIVPDQNELTLDIEVLADVATVRCAGKLTLTSASRFRHEVKRLLSQARVVIIDLTGLTMMDSLGLGTIASLYASARNAGRDLHVVNIGPRIREMFSVSRLLSLFEEAGKANVRIP
jgi:anti-sigma B factor antagonist